MVKKRTYFLTILVFGLILIGIFIYEFYEHNRIAHVLGTANTSCEYTYLNPLRCEPGLVEKKQEYITLKIALNEFIEKEKVKGNLKIASIYLRDLENGPIMNINGYHTFSPASLLKLPVMISYYDKAQDDPSLLQRKITVPDNIESISQNIKPKYAIQKGQSYTIDELINMMVKESDNLSSFLLLDYLNKNFPDENIYYTLSDLGIVDPSKSETEQIITVQTYASIFRMLYNSSYLNLEMSNKALELLTESEFKDGIVAGVPQDVKVAHKFGERNDGEEQQLHDCGVVYFKKNPYVLCVMTRGKNVLGLETIVQQISRMVYKEVEERN